MKKKIVFLSCLALLVCLSFLTGCQKKAANSEDGYTLDKDASYAIGMYLAAQFQIPDVHYDYKSFMDGYRDYTEAQETRFNMDTAIEKIQAAFEVLAARDESRGEEEGNKNKEEGELYLSQNGRRAGVITTPSGLQYEVISEGSGMKPDAEDWVQVHYEGTLINGTVFDSSYNRGEPAEFPLYGVIPGWTEGLQLMSEGSTYRFFIPSELAYGSRSMGDIPPNSTLIFKVELLSILDN